MKRVRGEVVSGIDPRSWLRGPQGNQYVRAFTGVWIDGPPRKRWAGGHPPPGKDMPMGPAGRDGRDAVNFVLVDRHINASVASVVARGELIAAEKAVSNVPMLMVATDN